MNVTPKDANFATEVLVQILFSHYEKKKTIQFNEFKISKIKLSPKYTIYKHKVNKITWFTRLSDKIHDFFKSDDTAKVRALRAFYDPEKIKQASEHYIKLANRTIV